MKIVLCQCNPIVGDIAGNVNKIKDILQDTKSQKPDLLVFPELFLQGYPPRDLLEQPWFITRGLAAIEEIALLSKQSPGTGILTGCAMPHNRGNGTGLHNAAVLIANGQILFHQNKTLLPSYDVFDEARYFDPADRIEVFTFKNEVLGITVCEDAWTDPELLLGNRYNFKPVDEVARQGASLLINISSSPFHHGKETLRFQLMQKHARNTGLPFVFVNQVGGNDELIFDGTSMYFDKEGNLCRVGKSFREDVISIDTAESGEPVSFPPVDSIGSICDALELGLRDYVKKCGFQKVIIGLSGGIDSAVTAAVAVRALGSDNVLGVTMPSCYSSTGSVDDSIALAEFLGIRCETIPIGPVFDSFLTVMEPHFANTESGVAEENMQARIRGNILMALSNKFNYLLLSTGNKSELAVGYCTLYGDMNGGLSVISDLPKTMVYKLARYINSEKELIPQNTISKPPSAELRPDQKDQDSLPDYEILDAILNGLVEEGKSLDEMAQAGFDRTIVNWVDRALKINEYKRRQAAPGLRVTPKAFGMGRRFPLAARFER